MKHFQYLLLFCCSVQASSVFGEIRIAHIKHTTGGYHNGIVVAIATGNAGPFTFAWSTGQIDPATNASTIQHLSPGTYTVTITTAAGSCSTILQALVEYCAEDPALEIIHENIIHPVNPGDNSGSIDLTISNPSGNPLMYSWYDNTTMLAIGYSEDISGLVSGSYSVVITNGCTITTRNFTLFDCTNAPPFSLQIIPQINNCKVDQDDIGTLTVETTFPGTHPQLSYQWSGPSNSGFVSANTATVTIPVKGRYCVTVTDGCGQTDTECFSANCCNTFELPGIVSNYECFGWYEDILGFEDFHPRDGILGVQLPFYSLDLVCNNRYTLTWWDGQEDEVYYDSENHVWHGNASRTVPMSSGDRDYCVTITNACGCSVTRCRAFGLDQRHAVYGFKTEPLSLSLSEVSGGSGYWDPSQSVITGCQSCRACGPSYDIEDVIFYNDAFQSFSCIEFWGTGDDMVFFDDNPYDESPCNGGGALYCSHNEPDPAAPWTVLPGQFAEEIVDYSVSEPIVVNGQIMCTHPAYCLIPGFSIDNFPYDNIPVLVKHPVGKIVPCNYTPPGIDPECPNGYAMYSPWPNKDCTLDVICSTNGKRLDTDVLEEEIVICRCTAPDPCKTVKRCKIFPHSPESTDCDAFEIVFTNCPDPDLPACFDVARPAPSEERAVSASDGVENTSVQSIRVFPNPTNGLIQVLFMNNSEKGEYPASIEIYDMIGRKLGEAPLTVSGFNFEHSLSLESFNVKPGAFILKVLIEGKIEGSFLLIKSN